MMQTLEEIEARKMKQAQSKEPQKDDTPPQDDPAPQDDYAKQEIEQLRQQMAALQGRLTPMQQQSEEFRRLYNDEHNQRKQEREAMQKEVEALQARLEESRATSNIEDLLSEEERDLFDPDQLKAFAKVADSVAKRRMPKIDVEAEVNRMLKQREMDDVKQFREQLLSDPQRGLADLSTLAVDSNFQTWVAQEDNDDFDPLVSSFLGASSRDEVSRLGKALARRVARYKENRGKPRQPDTDTRTNSLQRNPPEPSQQEMNAKLAEAKRLSRSRSKTDQTKAQKILDSLR